MPDAPLLRCYDARYSEELRRYHVLLDDVSETHVNASEKEPTLAYGLALSLRPVVRTPALQRLATVAATRSRWSRVGGSERDEGQDIQQTMDGGFIAVGTTSSNDMDVSGNHGGDGDVWVVKLSADGQLQWQKCLGGPSTDEGYAIHQASDGGYLVAGMAGSDGGDISGFHGYSDFWLLKLDTLGNVEWQKCLGGSYEEVAYAFMVTADGGIILTGITGSTNGDVTGFHGSRDGWVVKLAPYDVEIAESPTSSYPTYPIPASDRLNVALTTDQIGSPIAFLDAEGRMVLSARVESTPMDIDISLLVNGTYVLLIGDHYRSRVEVVR